MLGEPLVQGDTAYVGVSWIGCCARPTLRTCYPANAMFELVRRHGAWLINEAPFDTIA